MIIVDPFNLPKLMTRSQLEYWILFSICVAGKRADQTQKKLKAMLMNIQKRMPGYEPITAFGLVREAIYQRNLTYWLHKYRLGKYKLIGKAFHAAVQLDLDRISLEQLEQVPGIGPKSARMIMLYYDPTLSCVPLDTHILKWLATQGVPNVPKNTPASGSTYARLETAFQQLANKRNMSVRELDTKVWNSYALKSKEEVDRAGKERS